MPCHKNSQKEAGVGRYLKENIPDSCPLGANSPMAIYVGSSNIYLKTAPLPRLRNIELEVYLALLFLGEKEYLDYSYLSISGKELAVILEVAGHPSECLVLRTLLGVEVADQVALLLVQLGQLFQALVLLNRILRLFLERTSTAISRGNLLLK